MSTVKPFQKIEPWSEADRVAALHSYEILDTPREEAFDNVVRLIARVFGAPIAAVNLIDADRQWFKAEVGLGVRETPLATSFCAHALLQEDCMVVPDAATDARFACNPLVTGESHLRFYAGWLLKTPNGLPLGTLCVLDTRPRPEGITALQAETLEVMASLVMDQITLRRTLSERDRGAAALNTSEAKFAAVADSLPQMVWSTRADGVPDFLNARWCEFTGMPPDAVSGDSWADLIHPEDHARAWALWRHCLQTGDPFEIECRLRRYDGIYRWTLGRATPIRDAAGKIVRWFGTCTDIDDLKRMEQGKELLSQELSHRIKNIFAVISALIGLSARQFPEAKAFAAAVRERIGALARAHEFVRPHSEISRPAVGAMTLHAFLEALFKPYAANDGSPRVVITGDDARFDDQAATSVALLFHELATNAAKYGALSTAEGQVTLTTASVDNRFVLTWTERGGPAVTAAPDRQGFGSSLATVSVEGQLGGKLERIWGPEGLTVVADLPATALSRRKAAERASILASA